MNTIHDLKDAAKAPHFRWLLPTLVLVSLPFVVVDIPPITDLPQLSGQITLWKEYFAGNPDYVFQWWTPYSLSIMILGFFNLLFEPVIAGKLTFMMLTWMWSGAMFGLSFYRNVPPQVPFCLSILCFGPALYWGFASFMVGFPVLLATIAVVERFVERGGRSRFLMTGGLLSLLYFSHVFWFAIGIAAIVASLTKNRTRAAVLLLAASPVIALIAFFWLPSLDSQGFYSPTIWGLIPSMRMSLFWWLQMVIGGTSSWIEPVVFSTLALLFAYRWKQNREVDLLFKIGLLLLVAAIILPHLYQRTVLFSARWLLPALVILVLANGSTVWTRIESVLAIFLVCLFHFNTTLHWYFFNTELSGLRESIEQIEKSSESRVLGLSYIQESEFIHSSKRPFMQQFAWAQVYKGADLGFSFSEMAPLPIVKRDLGTKTPWTQGLEWYPNLVQDSDFDHFDYVLVFGNSEELAAHSSRLEPLGSQDQKWRLYRVVQ